MATERIMASVTLKSRSGLSVFRDLQSFSLSRLDEFRPKVNEVDQVVNLLTQAGFTIEAQTDVGVSFSGPRDLMKAEFGISIRRQTRVLQEPGMRQYEIAFYRASQPLFNSPRIIHIADAVHLAIPGIPFHNANPPAPNPPYYFLNVLNDVPNRLNVVPVHTVGITGAGVRISMVDTGFVTRVTETHVSTDSTRVTVEHPARHVQGVWLATDPNHTGTNYYTGGSFAGTTITLGTPLPGAHVNVEVLYSCLHPHYLAQGYNIDDIRAVGGLDVNTDEFGHGTAEAANALAVAPGCTFSFVKYSNGDGGNFPLAGFQAAVQHQNPNIITCSWGTGGIDNSLLLEIANAIASGIVVIFAAGNGHTDNPAAWVTSVTQPNSISVGGAYPIQAGGFQASNYASSYDSFIYTNPQRHCPDVVGLVGELPNACLIMLPTEPDDEMDNGLSNAGAFPNGDNTAANDGWCVCSGTSAAAPQTAGLAALLLQRHPGLTPMAIKNILENSARDIQTGSSNSSGPDTAAPGWDPATGFGLIDGQAAVNYLQNAFCPYIRDSIDDSGTEPVFANRLSASPDIIVRSEQVDDPQGELGQTVKHRYDLCDLVEDGQDNYIYLRVQNRGAVAGNCTATVYFTDPGMAIANPAAWTNIGQLNIQNLVAGEFRVVGPLTWPDTLVPASGHYCLISILDSPSDPAPDLTAIHSLDDFVYMVRNSNNVAWRNIDVEDVIPGGSSSWSFYMEGPQGASHHAELQVDLVNFPATATVLVKLLKRLADTATLDHMTVATQSQIYTTLNHQGGLGKLQNMDIKSNEKSKVTVYYSVPSGVPAGAYSIIARLFIDGINVGTYTKIVNISYFAFVGNRRTLEIHRIGCPWVAKMSPYNKLPLADLNQARKRGFDNCAVCIGGSKH